jgi:hypothetical protein
MSDLSCDETWPRGFEDPGKLAPRGDADDEADAIQAEVPAAVTDYASDSTDTISAAAAMGDDPPVPPYTEADKAEDGLKCFYTNCAYQTTSYGSLLHHCKNKHGRRFSELRGTYLHTMGIKEVSAKNHEYKTRKATTDASRCRAAKSDGGRPMACKDEDQTPEGRLRAIWSYKDEASA